MTYTEVKDEVKDIVIDLSYIVCIKDYHYTKIPNDKYIADDLLGIEQRINKLRNDILKQ